MCKHNLYLFLLLLCMSCGERAPLPFGVEFNKQRKEVGLKLLDSTFISFNSSSEEYKNYPVIRNIKGVSLFNGLSKPKYVQKVSYLNKKTGNIIFEEDIYSNGVKKPGVDRSIYELIIYRYTFNDYEEKISMTLPYFYDDKVYKEKWQYIHVYPEKYKVHVTNRKKSPLFEQKLDYITKAQADSILSSWGLRE